MNLQELKRKTPDELLVLAEKHGVENASTMLKQDIIFTILKNLAEQDTVITGDGVIEVLQDGFGFLRSPEANYLAGPDDIYVSPARFVVSVCVPVTRWKAKSAHPKTVNVTSRCSR